MTHIHTPTRHLPAYRDGHWSERAACAGARHPEWWHPTVMDTPSRMAVRSTHPQVAAAVSVCRRCPVAQQCYDLAVATGDQWAVMGGTTPAERIAARRQEQAAAAPEPQPEPVNHWPSHGTAWSRQEDMTLTTMLASPQIALASGVAFGLSELLNWAVYTPLRRRHGWARAVLLDTIVFLWIAGFPVWVAVVAPVVMLRAVLRDRLRTEGA